MNKYMFALKSKTGMMHRELSEFTNVLSGKIKSIIFDSSELISYFEPVFKYVDEFIPPCMAELSAQERYFMMNVTMKFHTQQSLLNSLAN